MLPTPTITMTPPQDAGTDDEEPSAPSLPEMRLSRSFQHGPFSADLRPGGSRSPGRRKCSFPAALCDLGGLALGASGGMSTRRRLSNVSDAVTRKLSMTIGWRSPTPPTEEIITQGRQLITRYVWQRLRNSKIPARRCGITHSQIVSSSAPGAELVLVSLELERRHPKLFNGVARQAGTAAGGLLATVDAAVTLLTHVGKELVTPGDGEPGVTWGKIAALFAVTGGLAVDCARGGHPEYVPKLINAAVDILEEDVVLWVASKGGWVTISQHCSTPTSQCTVLSQFVEWVNLNMGTFGGFGLTVASMLVLFISVVLALRAIL